jgi:hypothetical protein
MFHLIFRQLASRCHLCFVELAARADWLAELGVVPPYRQLLLNSLHPAPTERVRHNTRDSPLSLPTGPNSVSLKPSVPLFVMATSHSCAISSRPVLH